MSPRWLVLPVLVLTVLAGCSSDDDDEDGGRSTSTTTTTSTSTTTSASTSTVPFDGSTDPVSVPGTATRTALLRSVDVNHADGVDRVTFEFTGPGRPAVMLRYVDDPRADGSGEPVAVEGAATLEVRFEPAATADLTGEEPRRTYTGPDRVRGDTTVVTEVVRGGDFEAVLTWFVGVRAEAPFRVVLPPSSTQVILEVAAP